MSDKSSIQWTDATWNPIRGCTRVSEGCRNCYAERAAARFSGPGQPYEGLARYATNDGVPRWTGEVRLIEDHLEDPLRWNRPRRIFVNSMSDLFHEGLSDEAIDKVFAVMVRADQHIYQVLTKRAERMCSYFAGDAAWRIWKRLRDDSIGAPALASDVWGWLKHVHLGVSVEDQQTADERIPWLLKTPAAVRWVSYEPALGPVNFEHFLPWKAAYQAKALPSPLSNALATLTDVEGLDWIVVGGESGPRARPFDVQWARDTIAQCRVADVACFVKQLGARPYYVNGALDPAGGYLSLKDKKGGDWNEWPADLRVREYPLPLQEGAK